MTVFCNRNKKNSVLLGASPAADNDSYYHYDIFDDDTIIKVLQIFVPKYIFNDSFSSYSSTLPVTIYTVNLWLEQHMELYADVLHENNVETKFAVNFISNKSRLNRFLTIKMVELFDLDTNYSWSGIGREFDMHHVINEIKYLENNNRNFLTATEQSFLLAPIQLPAHWIEHPNNVFTSGQVENYGTNRWTWDNGLNKIFLSSAVSLITESIDTQKAIQFSEKTVYAMLGLTFPIWIGGYAQAEFWSKYGFDTFNDIIDHSYQYYETSIERCWYAIKFNIDLLKDKDQLALLRKTHMGRLKHNQDLLHTDCFYRHHNKVMQSWPNSAQQDFAPILESYRKPE